jgi:hypothetical protein
MIMASFALMRSDGHKGTIRAWVDRMLGHRAIPSRAHLVAGGNALIQGGEAAGTGVLLGAISANRTGGLDVTVKGKHVPADIVGGGIALAASALVPEEGYLSAGLRNAGSVAIGIGTFRKSHDYFAEKKMAGPAKPAVHGDEDEILRQAQGLR